MFNNFGLNFLEDVKYSLGQSHYYHAVMICMCLQYLPLYKLYKWHNGYIYRKTKLCMLKDWKENCQHLMMDVMFGGTMDHVSYFLKFACITYIILKTISYL